MTSRPFLPTLLLAAALVGCRATGGPAPSPARDAIATPADLVARVASEHPDAPATARFTQVNTLTLASGDITQRQRVTVAAPDRMRVDNLPLSGRTGAMYVGRRALSFASGRRVAAESERNPLLVLGFGIFRQSPAETLQALESLGVNLKVMREGTWGGSPVWIVGAAPGDSSSNQLWIDADRWLPVRFIQSERRGTRRVISDTRLSGHAAPAPTVPRRIEVYRGGRRALRGEVTGLETGVTVPAATFDTVRFAAVP